MARNKSQVSRFGLCPPLYYMKKRICKKNQGSFLIVFFSLLLLFICLFETGFLYLKFQAPLEFAL